MNTRRFTLALTLLLGLGLFAGCVEEDKSVDAQVQDTLRQLDQDLDISDLRSRIPAAYVQVEPDYRRCVSPLCGGYWVHNVNRRLTRCADGSYAERCYVTEINWDALGLSENQVGELRQNLGRLILQGRLMPKNYDRFGNLGEFQPRKSWLGANDRAPRGGFFRVEDKGFVCFAYPCFNLRSALLNSRRAWDHSGLDLRRVGATDDQLAEAQAALVEGDLLVAGRFRRDRPRRGGLQRGVTLHASQLYLPVEALECVADEECTTSVYQEPVGSPDDCYCRFCPLPISGAEARSNEAGWQTHCADLPMLCPQVRCANPPPVGCVDSTCAYVVDDDRR